MKSLLFLFAAAVACGGQIGDVDGGTAGDSGKSDTGTSKTCSKNSDCGTGICGFSMADGCSAKGQCFPEPGAICNAFSPGCACDGTTISIVCNGLPDGYAPAPVAYKGECAVDAGGPFTCGGATCSPGTELCYLSANPATGTCMPSNGCSDCACAQAMFQCVSTCKQDGGDITVQCQ